MHPNLWDTDKAVLRKQAEKGKNKGQSKIINKKATQKINK